jgi:D-alanyl-D-alanine dipeptidase
VRRALVALAVLGCGGRDPAPKPLPPAIAIDAAAGAAVVDGGAGAAVVDAAPVAVDASGSRTVRIPDDAGELVVAVAPDWRAKTATLTHWRRAAGGPWERVGAPWPAVIGVGGVAWGRGLHGDGAPAGRSGPAKREGDGKTPAGLFDLGGSYGVAVAAPVGTRVPYTPTSDHARCVDDPRSSHYNQIVDDPAVRIDWSSAEDLRRSDVQYDWVVDVRHNPGATPGAGSCIFLHVWRNAKGITVGCTAMAAGDLERLIARLDPAAHPRYVLLPAAEYAALADAWGLPPAASTR